MPPEEPGAPSTPPRDTGRTATFGAGVEQADTPEPKTPEPKEPDTAAVDGTEAARKVTPPRRRLLDDPDPDDGPKAPKAPKRPPKVRARKVHRIVRHIEPWSVLKISVLFFPSIFLIICVASAVLWNAARSAGAIDDVESFVTSLGFGNCEDIDGEDTSTTPTSAPRGGDPQVSGGSSTTVPAEETPRTSARPSPTKMGSAPRASAWSAGSSSRTPRIFESFALGGIVLVLTGASASVVLVLLFNLISDLTGGVRVTVLEEEPTRPRRDSPAPASRD